MQSRWLNAAPILLEAEDDIFIYMSLLVEHRKRIYSANVLESLNKEVQRRTNVVGGLPDKVSMIHLVGELLQEQDNQWEV